MVKGVQYLVPLFNNAADRLAARLGGDYLQATSLKIDAAAKLEDKKATHARDAQAKAHQNALELAHKQADETIRIAESKHSIQLRLNQSESKTHEKARNHCKDCEIEVEKEKQKTFFAMSNVKSVPEHTKPKQGFTTNNAKRIAQGTVVLLFFVLSFISVPVSKYVGGKLNNEGLTVAFVVGGMSYVLFLCYHLLVIVGRL